MAILTGNNGRVHIGRRAGVNGNGLTLGTTFTRTILPGRVDFWTGISYGVFPVTGRGGGGRVNPTTDLPRASQNVSSNLVFQVTDSGSGYAAGDSVYIGWWDGQRFTNNFELTDVSTIGIDTEGELLQQQYRVAKIRSWSLNAESDTIETTALGDVAKTYTPGLNSATGSATLLFYEDDLGFSDMLDSYELMNVIFPTGTAPLVTMSLAIDGRNEYDLSLSGGAGAYKTNFIVDAYITSASLGVSYGEVVAVDVNFTVNGPLRDRPWKPNVSPL